MGRLIDADALVYTIRHDLWDWDSVDDIKATTVLKQTIRDIENMPEILDTDEVALKDDTIHNLRLYLKEVLVDTGVANLLERRHPGLPGYVPEG